MKHYGTQTIEAERLVLRGFEQDDAEALKIRHTSLGGQICN